MTYRRPTGKDIPFLPVDSCRIRKARGDFSQNPQLRSKLDDIGSREFRE
jgi:hypothetical protein